MNGNNGVEWVEGKGKVSSAIGVLVQEKREFERDRGIVRRCMMICDYAWLQRRESRDSCG